MYCRVTRTNPAGVEHLLRDVKDASIGTLATEVGRMNAGLQGLRSRLGEVQQYLKLVTAGHMPVNHDIIYDLQVPPMSSFPNADCCLPYALGPNDPWCLGRAGQDAREQKLLLESPSSYIMPSVACLCELFLMASVVSETILFECASNACNRTRSTCCRT